MAKKLFNQSLRSFITKKGEFKPGTSMDFEEGEAKSLMVHKGVRDSASIVNTAEVEVDNAKIRAEIAALQTQIKAVEAERDELRAVVNALDADAKDLGKQVKKLQPDHKK